MSGVEVALVLATVALLAALVWAGRVAAHAHRRKVAVERVSGRLALRKRMADMAGHRHNPETYENVVRAETMYGYVWIRSTRKKAKFTEQHGWALTRRGARRKLAKASQPRTPRR